jgi:hypothetical protein
VYLIKLEDLSSRCLQILEPIPEIRSEGDGSSHCVVAAGVDRAGVSDPGYRL